MMRNTLFILATLFATSLYAQQEIKTSLPVKEAIVYLNGAQLFHEGKVTLKAGYSDIIVEDIANNLDAQSIQTGGKGAFTIMDVQYRLYYPEPVNNQELPDAIKKQISGVEDSIINVSFAQKRLLARREVLNIEKQMLYNNQLVKGSSANDSLELLVNSISYYDVQLTKILKELVSLEQDELEITKESQRLQQRLVELRNYYHQKYPQPNNSPIPQIIVSVQAERAGTMQLNINYLSYSAGWYATYDIRANDLGKPVNLTYKANVWQNSGIDWKDIQLTCSTGNPTIGNTPPQLTAWYLRYYQQQYGKRSDLLEEVTIASGSYNGAVEDAALKELDAGNVAMNTETVANITNMEFKIGLKYTIPSTGKARMVSLQESTMDADYNYLIIPKLDPDAFLIARVTGWENQGLLPGNANIYFGNSLVAKTYLNTLTFNDTLSLSLGRDKGIQIARTVLKDKSSNKLIGSDRKVERVIDIEVRNNKAVAADIIIMDQIPVSQDKTIKVELGDLEGADINELTGIITWRHELKPQSSITDRFSFIVTYPKDQVVNL